VLSRQSPRHRHAARGTPRAQSNKAARLQEPSAHPLQASTTGGTGAKVKEGDGGAAPLACPARDRSTGLAAWG